MGKKGSGTPIPQIKLSLDPTPKQRDDLLATLTTRFEANMRRHTELIWANVKARLDAHPEKLPALYAMESTGGEPDAVGVDEETGEIIFMDCAEQSPEGRRKIVYDGEARAEREKKGVSPAGSALELAAAMGIDVLDEAQYRHLQTLGEFDTTTSSWLKTPAVIRELGGAIFGDRRYDHVFVYHNSAPSFYSARGFRGVLRV